MKSIPLFPGPVVVFGPQACGKSINAKRLLRAFGKTNLVEELGPKGRLFDPDLGLTNMSETEVLKAFPHYPCVSYFEAIKFSLVRHGDTSQFVPTYRGSGYRGSKPIVPKLFGIK